MTNTETFDPLKFLEVTGRNFQSGPINYLAVNFRATRIQFLNSLSQLVKFQRIVEQDIKTELEKDSDNRQRMLPTYVSRLPDGTEVGDYIVLDFGGKFFRTGIQEPNKHNQVYYHQFHLF